MSIFPAAISYCQEKNGFLVPAKGRCQVLRAKCWTMTPPWAMMGPKDGPVSGLFCASLWYFLGLAYRGSALRHIWEVTFHWWLRAMFPGRVWSLGAWQVLALGKVGVWSFPNIRLILCRPCLAAWGNAVVAQPEQQPLKREFFPEVNRRGSRE